MIFFIDGPLPIMLYFAFTSLATVVMDFSTFFLGWGKICNASGESSLIDFDGVSDYLELILAFV